MISFHRRKPSADEGRSVLMAVASKGSGVINEHFGHAREFLIYEVAGEGAKLVGHRKTANYCSGGDTCGEEEDLLGGIIEALAGCEAVLCAKIGFEPWGRLEAAGIAPNGEHAMEPIEEALTAVWQEMRAAGKLRRQHRRKGARDGPGDNRELRQLLGLRAAVPEQGHLRSQAALPGRRREMHGMPWRPRRSAMRRDLSDRGRHRQ